MHAWGCLAVESSFATSSASTVSSSFDFEIFGVSEQNLKDFLSVFHLEIKVAHCMESPFEVRIPLIQIDDVQINLNSN